MSRRKRGRADDSTVIEISLDWTSKVPSSTLIYLVWEQKDDEPKLDFADKDTCNKILFSSISTTFFMSAQDAIDSVPSYINVKIIEFKLHTVLQVLDVKKIPSSARIYSHIVNSISENKYELIKDTLHQYELCGWIDIHRQQQQQQIHLFNDREKLLLIDEGKRTGIKQILITDMFANMKINSKVL